MVYSDFIFRFLVVGSVPRGWPKNAMGSSAILHTDSFPCQHLQPGGFSTTLDERSGGKKQGVKQSHSYHGRVGGSPKDDRRLASKMAM